MLTKQQIEALEQQRKFDINEGQALRLDQYAVMLRDVKRAIDAIQARHEDLWGHDTKELKTALTACYAEVLDASLRAEEKARDIRKNNK